MPELPAEILRDDGVFTPVKTLRYFPQKRWVGEATWQGQRVLAKVYLHPSRARRQAQQELAGHQLLKSAEIATPDCLDHDFEREQPIVIYQWLEKSQTGLELIGADQGQLDSRWVNAIVEMVASMHQAGIVQKDLHLGNFLRSGDTLYAIDGDDVESVRDGDVQAHANNLALLFAQFPVSLQSNGEFRELLKTYRDAGGASVEFKEFEVLLASARCRRRLKFQNKALRNSTQFGVIRLTSAQSGRLVGAYDKTTLSTAPDSFATLEKSFNAQANWLKKGNSASVISSSIEARQVVTKRYNVKNWRHFLLRHLKISRAKRSWQYGLYLRMCGVRTPQPYAFFERRVGPFLWQSYLVTAACSGQDCLSYFNSPADQHTHEQVTETVDKIVELFAQLHRLKIRHGDTKATNILIDSAGPVLIDLDAMQGHEENSRFESLMKADIARFLRNFSRHPEVHNKFVAAFGASELKHLLD